MSKIVVIVGPTASGKTDLSVILAQKFNGECINADSTQIFQGTDIATNKISESEMQSIPHHLFSIKKVNESYSVADYQRDGRKIINEVLERGKLPIIVGGTGLFINALIMNYNFNSKEHIPDFENKYSNLDNQELWNVLEKIDKEAALSIHPNNRYRVLRALEIFEINGQVKSTIIKNNKHMFYDEVIIIGIEPDRKLLHKKIEDRVLKLVEKGLFEEIKKAWSDNNYNETSQALKCIGGPEILSYLKNEINYERCIELMQRNNRRYARRQLTWFKNQFEDVKWFNHDYQNFQVMTENVSNYIHLKLNNL